MQTSANASNGIDPSGTSQEQSRFDTAIHKCSDTPLGSPSDLQSLASNTARIFKQRSPPSGPGEACIPPDSEEDANGNLLCSTAYVLPEDLKAVIAVLQKLSRRLTMQNPERGAIMESDVTGVRESLERLSSARGLSIEREQKERWLADLQQAVGDGERMLLSMSQKNPDPASRSSTETAPSSSSLCYPAGSAHSHVMDPSTAQAPFVAGTRLSTGGSQQNQSWRMGRISPTKILIKTSLGHLRKLSEALIGKKCGGRGCEWLAEIDDRFARDVLQVIEDTAHNDSVKRYMLRWLKHLSYAIEVLGNGREEEDLGKRCSDVITLRGTLGDNCGCEWISATLFAKRTWQHIHGCLLPSIQRNKQELRQIGLDERERKNASRRKKA
ncbi:hypothetical protein QFC20_002113 [Naganishia adeliensis]|uniref:Uncharacterized protein n=1 Tax=Naganishia adeliensis TaxID=92952 RepID=A0ACC2WNW7_9TREE|nr:hypothetical protein QFC20_002113 [Naganishia adeliensis]